MDKRVSKMKKAIILLFLTICANVLAQTNRLYTTQQGLATSNILSLAIDKRGLMWIAGNEHFGYFDGAQFHYLPATNPATGEPYFTLVNEVRQEDDDHYWLMTNGGLIYFDARHLTYEHVLLSKGETRPYSVVQMLSSKQHPDDRYVFTSGYGAYVLNNATHRVDEERTRRLQQVIQSSFSSRVYIDEKEHLWFSSVERQIMCIDLATLRKVPFGMDADVESHLRSHIVNRILSVPDHNAIYFTSASGVLKYDRRTRKLSLLPSTIGKPYTSLLYTHDKQLLVGTDSYGMCLLNRDESIQSYILEDQLFDLSLGKVKDIVEDKDGNLAVALLQKGIFVIPKRTDAFRFHTISLHGDGKNSSCITSLQIDAKGNYWIATDGAGVFTTKGTHMSTAHPVNDGLRSLLVQSVVLDKDGRPWVGSYGGGVQYYDGRSQRFVTPSWLNAIGEMLVLSLAIDPTSQHIYAGTNGGGVYDIDIAGQTCTRMGADKQLGDWITTLYVDAERTLWVAGVDRVSYMNLVSGAHGHIDESLLPQMTQSIASTRSDGGKRMLFGTSKGLACYNPADGSMQWMLRDVPILSINQTKDQIWVSSSGCIYAIDKDDSSTTVYNSLGGYFIGEFHRSSTLDNHIGNLLFGCDNGIVCFTPKALNSERRIRNKILFTALHVGERDINYSDSTTYLDANILDATTIRLPHDENTFTLHFAVPDLCTPQQIHYEYFLKGYDTDWVRCAKSDGQYARYTNLAPGTYTLKVRAHIEGLTQSMTEHTITIRIDAPWYATWYAYIIYIILCVGIAYEFYRVWNMRRIQKRELNEALRNEEIKEAKLRLFTSITHELRTPLTMILSPLRQLLTTTHDKQQLSSLNVMAHNCERLLDIVRQITDIRKIDAGQFQLHFEEVDLCTYTHKIAESFMGAATAKHINFSIESNQSAISVWIDPIHFEKVVVNILSNAFKFCPTNSRVLIRNRRQGDYVEMSIFNGGSHIDEGDMQHIFERFYQSASGQKHAGSGIGLNLAYELVQLHHGTITSTNIEPDGVEFTVRIPAGLAHLTAEELEPRPVEEATATVGTEAPEQTEEGTTQQAITTHVQTIHTEASTNEGQPTSERPSMPRILVVDDSKDLCEYLRDQLSQTYSVTLAFSGHSAWDIILHARPDMIITDMKMPDGDGIELCKRVKSNPEFDHIPIIMLTGEGNEAVQLRSLHLQVDHYMAKPFNMEILQGVIRQVLGVRENLKRHIQRHEINRGYETVEIASAEDKLYERINTAVQEHLDDDQFSVQQLADLVGVNRVHLNRKMKEKYGLSPNVYIKTYRLKQAAYLLINKRVNVSEVAFRVGFTTHSYFSSCFHDFFGMSPKDFISYYSEPENEPKLKKILE